MYFLQKYICDFPAIAMLGFSGWRFPAHRHKDGGSQPTVISVKISGDW